MSGAAALTLLIGAGTLLPGKGSLPVPLVRLHEARPEVYAGGGGTDL